MSPRSLKVLYVAYPMLPVTSSVAGGAEQMLWTLEREMAARGHRTFVAACDGSRVSGKLVATGEAPEQMDAIEARRAEHEHAVLEEVRRAELRGDPYDLIHDKSGSFWLRAREVDAPVLATLHLPRSFYAAGAFDHLPPNLFLNCVSESQRRSFADVRRLYGVVMNGIRVQEFPQPADRRDGYLLWLGRICHEKGPHLAIEVAERVGLPLVIAGDLYRFSYHQAYFDSKILPHLQGRNARVLFVGAPPFHEKLRLLRRARALLVPSLVEETSSLVSMEAMACGTPVIAFRNGALPEVVCDGVTGIVADSMEEMIAAVSRVDHIQPRACRLYVETRFPSQRMAHRYEQMYRMVIDAPETMSAVSAA